MQMTHYTYTVRKAIKTTQGSKILFCFHNLTIHTQSVRLLRHYRAKMGYTALFSLYIHSP